MVLEGSSENIKEQIRLHLIDIYNEVLQELKREEKISRFFPDMNANYRSFGTREMDLYFQEYDSYYGYEDNYLYNYFISPGDVEDRFGLLYPRITLEVYPQEALAADLRERPFPNLSKVSYLAAENGGRKIHFQHLKRKYSERVLLYDEPAGVDERNTTALAEIDDAEIRRTIKEGILSMFEFEDSILEKLRVFMG